MRLFGANRPTRAFTLVEVLVVIGLISLLVGILLPVMGRVREQSRTVHCAACLREIGAAIQGRATRSGGYAPLLGLVVVGSNTDLAAVVGDAGRKRYSYVDDVSVGTSASSFAPLPYALGAEFGTPVGMTADSFAVSQFLAGGGRALEMFVCPADFDEKVAASSAAVVRIGGIDSQVFWEHRQSYGFNGQILGIDAVGRSKRFCAGKLDAIRRTAQVMLAADVSGPTSATARDTFWASMSAAADRSLSLDDGFSRTGAFDYVPSLPVGRHRAGINVLFADAHVATVPLTSPSLHAVLIDP